MDAHLAQRVADLERRVAALEPQQGAMDAVERLSLADLKQALFEDFFQAEVVKKVKNEIDQNPKLADSNAS